MKKYIALSLFSLTAYAGNVSESYRIVYSTNNVTSTAYVELVHSLARPTKHLTVFDSSGNTNLLALGKSGSEITQVIIPPGGIDVPVDFSQGARITIKGSTATSSTGEIDAVFSY